MVRIGKTSGGTKPAYQVMSAFGPSGQGKPRSEEKEEEGRGVDADSKCVETDNLDHGVFSPTDVSSHSIQSFSHFPITCRRCQDILRNQPRPRTRTASPSSSLAQLNNRPQCLPPPPPPPSPSSTELHEPYSWQQMETPWRLHSTQLANHSFLPVESSSSNGVETIVASSAQTADGHDTSTLAAETRPSSSISHTDGYHHGLCVSRKGIDNDSPMCIGVGFGESKRQATPDATFPVLQGAPRNGVRFGYRMLLINRMYRHHIVANHQAPTASRPCLPNSVQL